MNKKKYEDLKFILEKTPVITEELTEIDSLVSANECTGMGRIYPNLEGEDLQDVFDIAKENKKQKER